MWTTCMCVEIYFFLSLGSNKQIWTWLLVHGWEISEKKEVFIVLCYTWKIFSLLFNIMSQTEKNTPKINYKSGFFFPLKNKWAIIISSSHNAITQLIIGMVICLNVSSAHVWNSNKSAFLLWFSPKLVKFNFGYINTLKDFCYNV